jgi:hypothetical protein
MKPPPREIVSADNTEISREKTELEIGNVIRPLPGIYQ